MNGISCNGGVSYMPFVVFYAGGENGDVGSVLYSNRYQLQSPRDVFKLRLCTFMAGIVINERSPLSTRSFNVTNY